MSARRKRKRRNRIMATCLLSVIIALCIALAVLVFQNGRNMDLTCAFSDIQPQDTDISSTALLKAEPFAADLCVSDGDVDNSAISLNGSEKGALFNVEKKQVMFGEQMFEKVYPASITKIMTAILAVKYGNMDDTVTITEEDITLEEDPRWWGLPLEIPLLWMSFSMAFWFIPAMTAPWRSHVISVALWNNLLK